MSMTTGPAKIVLTCFDGRGVHTHHFKDEAALMGHVFMDKLNYLNDLAEKNRHVLYNIHFCNAGVGFQWFSPKKFRKETGMDWDEEAEAVQERMSDYKAGLVTYQYKSTLPEALDIEITRFELMY